MAARTLLGQSRIYIYILYTLFLCSACFGCCVFYWSVISDILKYPEYRTLKHYKLQWEYQPKTLILFLVIVYILTCFLVCSLYVIIAEILTDPYKRKAFYQTGQTHPILLAMLVTSAYLTVCALVGSLYVVLLPLFIRCWSQVRRYCPIKIKRRTFCFCNIARRKLFKILKSIHDTQSKWQPLTAENLDQQTKTCIMLIKNEACATMNCSQLEYALVGSSAEGLGKSYVLDLKNSYRDQWCRFLLQFFCCCLPCNTSFSCLRTDIDIIVKYNNKQLKPEGNSVERLRFQCKRLSTDTFSSLFNLEENVNAPGFAKIVLNTKISRTLAAPWMTFCVSSDRTYLSSSMIRKAVFDSVNSVDEKNLPASRIFGPFKHPPYIQLETKGPAVKLTLSPIGQAWYWNENQKFVIFEADLVFGIHCHQKWPQCAQNWCNRQRLWPSAADVEYLSKSGYVLVAKSPKTSQENDLEWLVSFPHCETYLGQHVPQVAKACYLALKIILKDHLMYICKCLKTYQLKSVLFWELEKHPVEFWEMDNIEECFLCLFDSFQDCVKRKNCPSYWIENHNLLHDCDDHEITELLFVLKRIRSNPAPYIEDVGSMWC